MAILEVTDSDFEEKVLRTVKVIAGVKKKTENKEQTIEKNEEGNI